MPSETSKRYIAKMKLSNICEVVQELRDWEEHFAFWGYEDYEYACKIAKEELMRVSSSYCNEDVD
jgi:hypothetical protein